MRGFVPLRMRMLVRPLGVVGGLGVGAGLAGVIAAYLPWYEVIATVEMLGSERSRSVASLAGWQAHPWGWFVPALALAATVACGSVALDRSARRGSDLALMSGLALAAVVAVSGLVFPPVSRFDRAGSRLRELDQLADRLPQDVELSFSVRPGVGLWVALAAAAVVIAVGVAARRDR